MPQYPLRGGRAGAMPPGGYETMTRSRAGQREALAQAEADGATIETLADGTVQITMPDPPHWTRGASRAATGRPSSELARAAAGLELRRRQLELLALG